MAATPFFVLDASVTLAWTFEDETVAYAAAVREGTKTQRAIVPSLWKLEIANSLVSGERRGRITAAKADEFLLILQLLSIDVDAETDRHAWVETRRLAREQQLSVYDATYIELARRHGLPLATLDGQMQAAAARLGIARFEP